MVGEMLNNMSRKPAPWLSGEGPESFVVLSSRIRLARNVSEFPFPPAATVDTKDKIIDLIHGAIDRVPTLKHGNFFKSSDVDSLSQQFLAERHLISPQFMVEGTGRGLFI